MSGSDIAISLFDKMRREDICREPFPHIVVDNVFPEDFANRLLLSMPEFNSIKQEIHCTSYRFKEDGEPIDGSKFIFDSLSVEKKENMILWNEFFKTLLKKEEARKFWRCFEDEIASVYPSLYEQLHNFDSWRVGRRGQDAAEDHDFLLDAELVYHSPSTSVSQERGPHIKVRNKVLECHFMMRHPEDRTEGGDLELYRFNEKCFITYEPQQQIKNLASITRVKTIPFKHNQCVAWLNTASTVMTYSPRQPGVWPLQYMAALIQLPMPIFALPSYAAGKAARP